MVDGLSVLGGLAAIAQLSGVVVNYIKTAKRGTEERQRIVSEINSTTAICKNLSDCSEISGPEPWMITLKILDTPDGPVAQFLQCLEYLRSKLAPKTSRLATFVQVLSWPLDKEEVLDVLAKIERQKSLFNIALTNNHTRLSVAIKQEVSEISKNVHVIRLHQDDERKESLLSKLSTIDFEATHADVSSRRVDGTGKWFLDTTEFKTWLTSPGSLHCEGMPGAGKTVLSSLVIDSLRDMKVAGRGVAGIYCSYRQPQSTTQFMGSLLQQLAKPLQEIPESIASQTYPINLKHLSCLFGDVLKSYKEVMVVIDALDECADRENLLKKIRAVFELNTCKNSFIETNDLLS